MLDPTGEYGTLERLGYRVARTLSEHDRLLFSPLNLRSPWSKLRKRRWIRL